MKQRKQLFTQTEIANKLGISKGTLSKWISKNNVSPEKITGNKKLYTETIISDYRNAKNALGVWEKVPYYTVDDTIPYGHGEKSVMMITEYMKLTSEEKYAIRWHMGFTEPKEQYGTIGLAYTKYPLALLLFEADLEATYFFDT